MVYKPKKNNVENLRLFMEKLKKETEDNNKTQSKDNNANNNQHPNK